MMAGRRNAGLRMVIALIVALAAAFITGGVLARGHTVAPVPPATALTSARVAATHSPLPTPTVTMPTRVATEQATVGRASPAIPSPTVIPPTSPATPARVGWIEVGRWAGDAVMVTHPFTVHGPWRLCWSRPVIGNVFQVMIGNQDQASWDIRSGPSGAPLGAFDISEGGTFSLMFHDETPYSAWVIEPPPGVSAAALLPPPCGD